MSETNYQNAKEKLVLALDVNTLDEAKELVYDLKDYVGTFKIGLQLFTSQGPEVIKLIHGEGGKIFFDGKFHDIPNTVAKASASLIQHGITFFNMHITGGSKMLTAAVKQSKETAKQCGLPAPTILGVTILTSIGQRTLADELGISIDLDEYVGKLAKLAKDSGLTGVVASAADVEKIRKTCGDDFTILCPAIRPSWAVVNDQIRVVTPADAINKGVDYLVVGRPITEADNRKDAAKKIVEEIQIAMDNYEKNK